MKTLILVLLLVLSGAVLADPPVPRTADDILTQWFNAAIHTWRDADGNLVVADCFDGAEQRLAPQWVPLLPDLAALSPLLIRDLAPELQTIERLKLKGKRADDRALRVLVMAKTDWSQDTLHALINLCWGQSVSTNQSTGPCDKGRCDCSDIPGDCMTRHADPEGMPLPCTPPRELCNVTIVKGLKIGYNLELSTR